MKSFIESIYIISAICLISPVLMAGCCSGKTDCGKDACPDNDSKCSREQRRSICADVVEVPAMEVKDACRDMAEAMLKAIKKADYELFVNALPEGCEVPVTAEEFEASSAVLEGQFGDLVDYSFLTELDTPMVHNQLWKTTFHRKDSEGNPVSQELIFRFVTAERDGCNQIIGFGFM